MATAAATHTYDNIKEENSVDRVMTKSYLTKILDKNTPVANHSLILFVDSRTGELHAVDFPVGKEKATVPKKTVASMTIPKAEKDGKTIDTQAIVEPQIPEEVTVETPMMNFNYESLASGYKITTPDGVSHTIVAYNDGSKAAGGKSRYLFPNGPIVNSGVIKTISSNVGSIKKNINGERIKDTFSEVGQSVIPGDESIENDNLSDGLAAPASAPNATSEVASTPTKTKKEKVTAKASTTEHTAKTEEKK